MKNTDYRTIELGDAIIEVTFLRGTLDGQPGWWCVRQGKNIDYDEIGFREARFLGKEAQRPGWTPGMEMAASAVHLTFCDRTGEGLTCPVASPERIASRGGMGRDGAGFTVIARRTRTERVHHNAASETIQ